MKILVIGHSHYASYESSCARYFTREGHEVEIWDSKSFSCIGINIKWWKLKKILREFYNVFSSLLFIRKTKIFQPDVIFMPKAENIHWRAVRYVKNNIGAALIVWYPDNPFRAENTSMNILRNLERIDIFYIWGKYLIDPLKASGCRRVEYLPFGFDPELHDLSEQPANRDIDCLHIGSYSIEKRNDLLPLANCGLQIWGPGWENEKLSNGFLASCVHGAGLYGPEMVKAYRRAVVIANPIRMQNMPAHNLRTIEAAGIGGGVVLTQRTKEQSDELFTEGEHLLCYSTPNEMAQKAHWALSNPEKAAEMSVKARRHVISEHLLEYRIKTILNDINDLIVDKNLARS
jgi:spore maturation protein CgeB